METCQSVRELTSINLIMKVLDVAMEPVQARAPLPSLC